jgi:hypothetical protein
MAWGLSGGWCNLIGHTGLGFQRGHLTCLDPKAADLSGNLSFTTANMQRATWKTGIPVGKHGFRI